MRNRVRATATLLALVATAGTVTACGSSAKTSGSASAASSASSAPGRAAFQAYLTCLGQHGVTLPSAFPRGNRPSGRPSVRPTDRPSDRPGGGFGGRFGFGDQPPAGVDAQTWQSAQQACGSLRPSAGPRGGGNNGAFAAYRNCLADHGVTMSAGPNGLATSDPKVAAAMKVCEPLRPTGRPWPAPTGSPTA